MIGCVIRVYIGSCVATSRSGYLILYFVRTYVTVVTMYTVSEGGGGGGKVTPQFKFWVRNS